MPGGSLKPNRYIKSDLKSKKIYWEQEHPIRWSYMKILREYSTLKEFYPDINPYVEAYKMRNNMWALYSDSFDGAGDPWMYLIEGPQKAMLIDTAFGVGDLKGLVRKLIGDKELIVVNTHHHYDHCYGNCQFDKCYCHKDEYYCLKQTVNEHIWDYLFDKETGVPIYTQFDKNDLIEFKEYELKTFDNNYCFDLGNGYLVETIPLRGHTAGQCGFLDRVNHTMFTGDITGIGLAKQGEPNPNNCTVEMLKEDLEKIVARMDEIEGVFPGHGMLDQTNTVLEYELNTLESILRNPENYDSSVEIEKNGKMIKSCKKNIYQSTAIRYSINNVYKK